MLEQLDQFDFHSRLEEHQQVALVAFGSAGCGACRHLKQVLAQLAEAHPQWLVAEVDAAQDAALVREFEVFHLPSLFLFNRGEYHCPLQAAASPEAIERAIAIALTEPALEAP